MDNSNEDRLIEELQLFKAEQLDTLRELGISTLGELLGATRGLEKLPILVEETTWREACKLIAELVGNKTLDNYQQSQPIPAMGLKIGDKKWEDI